MDGIGDRPVGAPQAPPSIRFAGLRITPLGVEACVDLLAARAPTAPFDVFVTPNVEHAFLRLGNAESGLDSVEKGLAYCRDTSERLFEPSLWRLKGELSTIAVDDGSIRRGRSRSAAVCAAAAR